MAIKTHTHNKPTSHFLLLKTFLREKNSVLWKQDYRFGLLLINSLVGLYGYTYIFYPHLLEYGNQKFNDFIDQFFSLPF